MIALCLIKSAWVGTIFLNPFPDKSSLNCFYWTPFIFRMREYFYYQFNYLWYLTVWIIHLIRKNTQHIFIIWYTICSMSHGVRLDWLFVWFWVQDRFGVISVIFPCNRFLKLYSSFWIVEWTSYTKCGCLNAYFLA